MTLDLYSNNVDIQNDFRSDFGDVDKFSSSGVNAFLGSCQTAGDTSTFVFSTVSLRSVMTV